MMKRNRVNNHGYVNSKRVVVKQQRNITQLVLYNIVSIISIKWKPRSRFQLY